MTEVQKYKQVKAVINDIPNYMEYQPTKEQNEAFDVVLELLNEAIEKATVPCFKCKYYKETDAEWKSGKCLFIGNCHTFAEESCDHGESEAQVSNKSDEHLRCSSERWIISDDGRCICPDCGKGSFRYMFCPNCGALNRPESEDK